MAHFAWLKVSPQWFSVNIIVTRNSNMTSNFGSGAHNLCNVGEDTYALYFPSFFTDGVKLAECPQQTTSCSARSNRTMFAGVVDKLERTIHVKLSL